MSFPTVPIFSVGRGWCVVRVWGLHVALPVGIGAGIYLLWRSPSLRVFDWVRAVSLGGPVGWAREQVAGVPLPEVVVYVLPDMLWTYALTSLMAQIWRGQRGIAATLWGLLGVAIGCGGEVLQAVGLLPGTADWLDLIGCAGAGLLAFALARRRSE